MIRQVCLLFSGIFLVSGLNSQVTFIVDSLPLYTPPEDILYIAGDFQGWNPGDPDYALQKNAEEKWFITLEPMTQGTTIEFKFTRGNWGKVEKGEFGQEIPNRTFTFGNGDTVSIIIYNWADISGGNSTAADNVTVVEDVYMPQLDRYRDLWIYLPPDYESSDKHYPVIYMHDGQNLFDLYTSFTREWEVDETLNELYEEGYQVPIVIGIENGGTERINEYTPWSNPDYGGGQGSLYIDFIVETLKPDVDQELRTLPGRESTAIWGSSLGGLISHYASLKFQDVFGKVGIYSPSYWFSDSVWIFTEQSGHQQVMRIYQMTGSLEGGPMVQNTWDMHDLLTSLGLDDDELFTTVIVGGQHNESLWRSQFRETYLWLFHSYANGVHENHSIRKITLSPNPATDRLNLEVTDPMRTTSYRILDLSGRPVTGLTRIAGSNLDISNLKPGIYFLEYANNEIIYRGQFVKY